MKLDHDPILQFARLPLDVQQELLDAVNWVGGDIDSPSRTPIIFYSAAEALDACAPGLPRTIANARAMSRAWFARAHFLERGLQ